MPGTWTSSGQGESRSSGDNQVRTCGSLCTYMVTNLDVVERTIFNTMNQSFIPKRLCYICTLTCILLSHSQASMDISQRGRSTAHSIIQACLGHSKTYRDPNHDLLASLFYIKAWHIRRYHTSACTQSNSMTKCLPQARSIQLIFHEQQMTHARKQESRR